jgi:hypothetical protein
MGGDDGSANTLPFLVDEQENKRQNDDAMEALQRMAFESGYHVMGSSGGGKQQRQYACAALCTIGINQATDNPANINRRLTVVRKTMSPDQWLPLQRALLDACTVAAGQALVLRTANHGHTIQQDYVPAFEAALAPYYDSSAGGRKLEAMALVAAHACSATTTGPMDAATATAWLQQVGWVFGDGAASDDTSQLPEGLRLLQELLAVPATLQLQELADGPMVATHTTVGGLVATAQGGGPMALGPAAANGARARSYLWARYGLGICQGDHADHLLWATGPAGKARQVAMGKQDRLKQWAQGNDAKRHLAALPGVQTVRLRPMAGTLAGYGSSSMPPAHGLALPLALLADAQEAAQAAPPADATNPPPIW